MGLFKSNYDKPGPGVSKDEPRKKGIPRFFEVFAGNIGDHIKLSLMFCICVIPTAALFFTGLVGLYTGVAFILSLVFAFPVGGAAVALVFCITKMLRDEPGYVWYDFKRKFLENARSGKVKMRVADFGLMR